MAEITAALVKELREKTGAGMMDCKKALSENAGDLEEAVDWLRTKGLSAAAKKAGRVAAEGLVAVETEGKAGAIVEVNSETDFVSRNDDFQAFARNVAAVALAQRGDLAAVKAASYPGEGVAVEERLTQLIAKIGENMTLRRAAHLAVDSGAIAGYVHNQAAPGLGKIGVLVALESTGDAGKLEALGRQIAMHVAATSPQSVSKDDLDPATVERERNILSEQARASGKPENVIEKMIEGRLRKFYEEVCLLDQTFVIDGERTVRQAVEDAAKEVGAPIRVAGFIRYQLGEGIERKESDFAAEVAAQLA